MLASYSFIPENKEAYRRCHEILGLPEEVHWSKLEVTFGSGDFGEVVLTLIPTGEQVRDLAEVGIQCTRDSCVKDDMPNEGELEEALLDAARSTMHSDPDMGPAG